MAEKPPPSTPHLPIMATRVRAVYREAGGTIHLDWPIGRLAEAVADEGGAVWLDVDDRGVDLTGVEALFQEVFHFHPLAIEDALQQANLAKIDNWGTYLYLVFHTLEFDSTLLEVHLQELDIFLGPNYLVTYHAVGMPILEDLRVLIERDGGQRMELGPDHLLYHLLDRAVAAYLPAFEKLDDVVDSIQDDLIGRPTPASLRRIIQVKHAALRLHRALLPHRELLNRLARDELAPIDAKDRVYFRDVYDHLVRLHDISETLRDLIAGALDTYLSALSNRTNDVMKTLTIVTVLFLPLNFLVGFFGMNFFGDNIALREANIPHVAIFAGLCALMVLAPALMWAWAKWRGWF